MRVHFNLNGEYTEVEADAAELLVDVLRLKMGLRGARPGCLRGQCGSCTIIFNGLLAPSCLIPVFRAYGAEVVTIEGLMQTRAYSDIERGLERAGAQPCRFCAAGKFLSVHALLESGQELTERTIHDALSGVWCRCTTHERLVSGVRYAARIRQRRLQRG